MRSYVAVAIPGEAAALWALAAGHGSDFALALAATSLVAMVAVYARSISLHHED